MLFAFLFTFVAQAVAFSIPPGPHIPPLVARDPPNDLMITAAPFDNLFSKYNDTSGVITAWVHDSKVVDYMHASPEYPEFSGYDKDVRVRIASITKLFTVLAVILSKDKLSWDASIQEFIPELNDNYKEVTIGALAGHTSGLGYFGNVEDLSVVPGFNRSAFGLPELAVEDIPKCDLLPGSRECEYSEEMAMFNDRKQVPRYPNSGPLYSNIGFNLLGIALSKVHSKPYEDVIADLIFNPLDMTHSSFDTPNDDAFLPKTDDDWDADILGNFNPTGGIWSSAADLSKFLRAILKHKLLSPTETRKWLQSRSATNNLYQLVGAPWEIFRGRQSFGRHIDVYRKSGNIPGYAGFAVLVPDFELVVTVNMAGNSSARASKEAVNMVTEELIQRLDRISYNILRENYGGEYEAGCGEKDRSTCSYIWLGFDKGGPGLMIEAKHFVINGKNIFASLSALVGTSVQNLDARIYVKDLDGPVDGTESWRMYLSQKSIANVEDDDNPAWMNGDQYRYGGRPLDEWKFTIKDGEAVELELPAWGLKLNKVRKFRP